MSTPGSVPLPPPGPGTRSECPLCGGPVGAGAEHCPDCGMSLAGVGGRPGPFSGRVLWWWAGGLLAVYLVVLVVVALVR